MNNDASISTEESVPLLVCSKVDIPVDSKRDCTKCLCDTAMDVVTGNGNPRFINQEGNAFVPAVNEEISLMETLRVIEDYRSHSGYLEILHEELLGLMLGSDDASNVSRGDRAFVAMDTYDRVLQVRFPEVAPQVDAYLTEGSSASEYTVSSLTEYTCSTVDMTASLESDDDSVEFYDAKDTWREEREDVFPRFSHVGEPMELRAYNDSNWAGDEVWRARRQRSFEGINMLTQQFQPLQRPASEFHMALTMPIHATMDLLNHPYI